MFGLQRWSSGEAGVWGSHREECRGGERRFSRDSRSSELGPTLVSVPEGTDPALPSLGAPALCVGLCWVTVFGSVPAVSCKLPVGWFLPWSTPCPLAWAELGGKLINKREDTKQGGSGLSRGLTGGTGSNPSSATYCSVWLWLRPSLSLGPFHPYVLINNRIENTSQVLGLLPGT